MTSSDLSQPILRDAPPPRRGNSAVDYVLKPVKRERLAMAIERIKKRLARARPPT